MEVMKTWVVCSLDLGTQTIFQTYEGKFYITTHIVGRLGEITEDEAKELIRNTPKFLNRWTPVK